jgi:hypothetical protein
MKLCVAGCSFSDYYKSVPNVYGDILAKKLNSEYIHHATTAGNNYRIWREVSALVMSNEITPSDILIIQYTQTTRNEFWSAVPYKPQVRNGVDYVENYNNDGTIIRYKLNAAKWQDNTIEKEFFKMYEANFLNTNFEEEKFKVYNEMFQHFLLNYKIPTIFLKTEYCSENLSLLSHFEALSYSFDIAPGTELSNDDRCHLNLYGHTILANNLYDHIIDKKLI